MASSYRHRLGATAFFFAACLVTLAQDSEPPVIFKHPTSETVIAGDNVALSVGYTPIDGTLCQWYKNGTPFGEPAPSGILFIDADVPEDGGTFHAVVTNAAGSATSNTAEVVVEMPPAPRILRQPQGGASYVGSLFLIDPAVNGRNLTIQWFRNGVLFSEGTHDNLQLGPLTKQDEGTYYFIASNWGGSVTSNTITVTVLDYVLPAITQMPYSTSAPVGGRASFGTAVDPDTQPQDMFWTRDGTRVPNSGNPPGLTLEPVSANDDGTYVFHASNPAGTSDSTPATLTVTSCPPATILELGGAVGDTSGAGAFWQDLSVYTIDMLKDGAPFTQPMPSSAYAVAAGEYMRVFTGPEGIFTGAPELWFDQRASDQIQRANFPDTPWPEQWRVAEEWNGVVHFLFSISARIRRYDLTSHTWLPELSIPGDAAGNIARAMHIDEDGIVLPIGPALLRFSHDLTSSTLLNSSNANISIDHLESTVDALIARSPTSHGAKFSFFDRSTGALLTTYTDEYRILDQVVATGRSGQCFILQNLGSIQIHRAELNSTRNALVMQSSEPSDSRPRSKLRLSRDETIVASTGGAVFDAQTLKRITTFAPHAQDLVFLPDGGTILVSDWRLVRLDEQWQEVASAALTEPADRVFCTESEAVVFRNPTFLGDELRVQRIELASLKPAVQPAPRQPGTFEYTPDALCVDGRGTVFVLDRLHGSIHRWSVAEGRYLSSFGVIGTPRTMGFASDWNLLFLGYADGRIDLIDPSTGIQERFAAVVGPVTSLTLAGEFLVARAGTWFDPGKPYVFDADGRLVSNANFEVGYTHVAWSAGDRRLLAFTWRETHGNDANSVSEYPLAEDGAIAFRDSPQHMLAVPTIKPVFGVSEDASRIVNARGIVYARPDYAVEATLPNVIDDAVWTEDTLVTLRARIDATEIQEWSRDTGYTLKSTRTVAGYPLRLARQDDGSWCVVTLRERRPLFHHLSEDLGVLSSHGGEVPSVALASAHQVAETAGAEIVLKVAEPGRPGSSLQWQVDGVDIVGATGTTFVLPSAQTFQAGDYRVRATWDDGVVHSPTISVQVTPPSASEARVTNLSTRALALGGDNQLIPGFVIDGPGTKRVLVRAVGPGMHDTFGMQGYLGDPQLSLRNQKTGTEIAFNDDWGTSLNKAEIAIVSGRVGAFPFLDGSKDAAILVDLPAGWYTAPAPGSDGQTGIAMVEIYDVDQENPTARLVNISNRGFVDIGDRIMIPGFVVSPEGPRTFLIRAIGPGLTTTFGLEGTLADPNLTIFRGEERIHSNDNWNSGPDPSTTVTVSRHVGAFNLEPSSADAAIVLTLAPGAYTIQATGKDDSTGITLVEVYVVP